MSEVDVEQAVMAVLSDPMNLPSTFWDYMVKRWLRDAPVFPISQVFGFPGYTAQAATPVATSQATTSTTYTDLATLGPTLTGLADGHYLLLFGAGYAFSDTNQIGAFVAPQVNATAASDVGAALSATTGGSTIMSAITATLSNAGANTVTSKYRAGGAGHTGTFQDRFLIALKFGNL